MSDDNAKNRLMEALHLAEEILNSADPKEIEGKFNQGMDLVLNIIPPDAPKLEGHLLKEWQKRQGQSGE